MALIFGAVVLLALHLYLRNDDHKSTIATNDRINKTNELHKEIKLRALREKEKITSLINSIISVNQSCEELKCEK